jgi:hypothetical protein
VGNVLIDRLNSIARTNVAPGVPALAEPSLYGFFYTVPAIGVSRRAFVLAGSPEMASHDDGRREIVAAGDVSPFALRRKTVRVLDNLSKLLNEMELGWSDASAVKLQLCCRCAITHGLRLVTYSRLETSSDLSTIQEPRSSCRKCRSSPSLNRSELRE